jgi:hypothetical protein
MLDTLSTRWTTRATAGAVRHSTTPLQHPPYVLNLLTSIRKSHQTNHWLVASQTFFPPGDVHATISNNIHTLLFPPLFPPLFPLLSTPLLSSPLLSSHLPIHANDDCFHSEGDRVHVESFDHFVDDFARKIAAVQPYLTGNTSYGRPMIH